MCTIICNLRNDDDPDHRHNGAVHARAQRRDHRQRRSTFPSLSFLPSFSFRGRRQFFEVAELSASPGVARWQNLIPCAPTPSTLAQSKERKGSNFAAQRSGAIVQKHEGAKHIRSKNMAIAIWQLCSVARRRRCVPSCFGG